MVMQKTLWRILARLEEPHAAKGKIGGQSYVFVANYRATPHPSTGEKPLQVIHELNSKDQAPHPPTS